MTGSIDILTRLRQIAAKKGKNNEVHALSWTHE